MIGLIALSFAYPHRLRIKERKQELYFAAAGLFGVAFYYLLENIALTYTLASNVGVIVCISPFFTAIFAHLFLEGEKLKPQFFVGFIVALAGMILTGFSGSIMLKLNPLGDVLAVLAAVAWAGYSVLTKKISGFQLQYDSNNPQDIFLRTGIYGARIVSFWIPPRYRSAHAASKHIQHSVPGPGRISALFCNMELGGSGIGRGENQRVYLFYSCYHGDYFRNCIAGKNHRGCRTGNRTYVGGAGDF